MGFIFYVDKILYQDYFDIVQNIIIKEKLDISLFLLSNKCITISKKIKKLLVPYYYYKYCSNHMNISKLKNLTTRDRTFMLISYKDKNYIDCQTTRQINCYYYLNLFCDTFNLLTPYQKDKSVPVNTYKNLLKKLIKNPNSGGYIIKSAYDILPNNIKEKLHIIEVKKGEYPVILTLT